MTDSTGPVVPHLWYDRDGLPISVWRWAELCRDGAYKRVGLTLVGDRAVSTVWLGVDMAPPPLDGIPTHHLLFETIVFEDFKPVPEYTVRYETEHAAVSGHNWTVEKLRKEDGLGKISRDR